VAKSLTKATSAYRDALEGIDTAKVKARQIIEASRQTLAAARNELNEAIVEEARKGTRQRDIVAVTGLSRERVRQICRAAGIEAED
jgi:hypothetical protein